jgi:8-oxo-dGTP pyrophosphatase MutT (NUDIX family)
MDLRASARELLSSHRPLDERERGFRDRMLALLDRSGDPFRRDHFDPGHFTASAIVLGPSGREMLEVHHGKLGLWLQPGGHIEPGDPTLALAARREVLEETDVVALDDEALGGRPLDLDIHTIPAHGDEPEHLHFDVRFLFRAVSRIARARHETRGVRWTSLENAARAGGDSLARRVVERLARL